MVDEVMCSHEEARWVLLAEVCEQCVFQERSGADAYGERPCIARCPVFTNLDALLEIAQTPDDQSPEVYGRAMRELVCDRCADALGGKDKCQRIDGWNCALRMYSGKAIEALRDEIDRVNPGARKPAGAAASLVGAHAQDGPAA